MNAKVVLKRWLTGLKALATLTENLGAVLSTHMVVHIHP